MASRLQLPSDDSVDLVVTHSNIKSFSTQVRFSLKVKPKTLLRSIVDGDMPGSILLFLSLRRRWSRPRRSSGGSAGRPWTWCASSSTMTPGPKCATWATIWGHLDSIPLKMGQWVHSLYCENVGYFWCGFVAIFDAAPYALLIWLIVRLVDERVWLQAPKLWRL